MKTIVFVRGWVTGLLALAGGVGLAGCGKPDAPPPTVHATPAPTAPPMPEDDGKDLDAKKLRRKANQAAESIGKYLDGEDPKLRAKVQKFADKVSDKFGKDKDQWRQRLEQKRQELQPKIDELRKRMAEGGDQTKGKLSDELAKLEGQNKEAADKLARLESIGADAWKKFKAQLKAEEAKGEAEEAKGKAEEAKGEAEEAKGKAGVGAGAKVRVSPTPGE